MASLQRKGIVEGMTDFTLYFDLYEHCVYGKYNWVIFASVATREKEILELVHSDVFGPMNVPSLGRYVYYVSFIDCFSWNTWIYLPQNKYEVFNKFKEFKRLVENQTEK